MKNRSLTFLVFLLVLALVACNSEETVLSTTSTLVTGPAPTDAPTETTTADPTPTTTVPGGGEASETTLRGQLVEGEEVVGRVSTDRGEIIHVVIPRGGYTDVDLYNFLGELKAADRELWGIEVFDDVEAAAAFADNGDEDLINRHHLVSLVDGAVVQYRGPFSATPDSVLGS